MTKRELEKLYDELNEECFFGNLPKAKIKTYATKQKYLGKIIVSINLETLKFSNFVIHISVRYANWTKDDYIGVLLHEMLHLYDYYMCSYHFFTKDEKGNILKYKYDQHGMFYQDMAFEIECDSGHHIFINDSPKDTKTLSERAIKIRDKKNKT